MHWLKREIWKVSIALAGMLLLLVLMVWVPVSAAGAYEGVSGLAGLVTATVQATPTVDATVTELNKEKLAQEVQQLKKQNEPDLLGWLLPNATIFLAVGGGIFAIVRYFSDRTAEHEKRVEELFQAAVTGLGDKEEGAEIGAATLLRTFLRQGYERYYTQVFDLAVANLRLPRTSKSPEDSDTPQHLTPLSRALIVLFKEAFPRARSQNKGGSQSPKRTYIQTRFKLTGIQSLDASGIQLDYANLEVADLSQVWMCQASLRKADLTGADLSGAYLWNTNLSGAYLWATDLSGANLLEAKLNGADLTGADLSGAYLWATDLSGANLLEAKLNGADLSGANIQEALSLENTDLRGVKGLDDKQKEACRAKGAINVPA